MLGAGVGAAEGDDLGPPGVGKGYPVPDDRRKGSIIASILMIFYNYLGL